MKKVLAVEPVAPMSAVDIECDILAQSGDKILTKNWNGEYIKLEPSFEKDGKTVYKITKQSFDRINLN